ncbi:MAG: hypothetical protein F6K25_16925 [Okeania sp. SIO2G4]|uniref:hypothetical protein n=1 Tax=unclassified Okeania TaxID=2634635 RepID=UPI0013B74244|nr:MULTISPECIES: hypothetical protein [unclassified Okeania]NEP03842.1 hypothetical protein [Okeania sp. SIO4D6]NEP40458.1 hypothetical protein [Okeania sp. SIO2H7]NEP73765.1 hypothetical protein [Okeania sp. SIO2G5]NEP94423.1 hypothetical protein [Okeania sp. SIO2F5]NEQ92291.1 hypothetical protein [Okeania sp. SIO2G4]
MIGNLYDHKFETPFNDQELPNWADGYLDKFCDLFWDNTWKEGDEAIASLEIDMLADRYAYIKEGMALRAFQIYKLYKNLGYKTFKEYCLKGLKKSVYYVKRVIKAAQISWSLMLEGFTELPDNVSQAQKLASSASQVSEEVDETVSCWQEVLGKAKQESKPITANYIETTITGETIPPLATAKLPRDVWDKLKAQAKQQGVKPEKLLEDIVGNYLDPKQDSDPETEVESEPDSIDKSKISISKTPKIKAWEKDLQDLVQEKYTNEVNYDTTTNSSAIPEIFQSDRDISSASRGQVWRPPT